MRNFAKLLIGVLALTIAGLMPAFAQDASRVGVVVKIGGIPWFNSMEAGIKTRADELGIDAFMIGPTSTDPALQVRAIEDLIAQGVDAIGVVPNDAGVLEPVLARLAEKAKASGITLGLEAVNRYESNLINTGAQAMDFIRESGSDNIKVHLDSYHMNIEEGDLAASIKTCGDMLGYFHVGESHRDYLGTGTIDFRTIFRNLADIDYMGTITFESFSSAVVDPKLSTALAVWRNLWSDGEDLATHAKNFMDAELHAAIKRA
ncbi:MAG: TIM barrel protein [Woeseiaceae bacterium]|nr:TIM barrel protein [Woeseiaceae bacterium]